MKVTISNAVLPQQIEICDVDKHVVSELCSVCCNKTLIVHIWTDQDRSSPIYNSQQIYSLLHTQQCRQTKTGTLLSVKIV